MSDWPTSSHTQRDHPSKTSQLSPIPIPTHAPIPPLLPSEPHQIQHASAQQDGARPHPIKPNPRTGASGPPAQRPSAQDNNPRSPARLRFRRGYGKRGWRRWSVIGKGKRGMRSERRAAFRHFLIPALWLRFCGWFWARMCWTGALARSAVAEHFPFRQGEDSARADAGAERIGVRVPPML